MVMWVYAYKNEKVVDVNPEGKKDAHLCSLLGLMAGGMLKYACTIWSLLKPSLSFGTATSRRLVLKVLH